MKMLPVNMFKIGDFGYSNSMSDIQKVRIFGEYAIIAGRRIAIYIYKYNKEVIINVFGI